MTSSNSGGIVGGITVKAEIPKNSQDSGHVAAKQIEPVKKPVATQPTTIKGIILHTSAPKNSEPPHSYSHLLETCDLTPTEFKSESKFSRPKTIRNLPKTESTKIRQPVSYNPSQKVVMKAVCL